MITINKPVIVKANGKSRLSADIDVDGKVYPLWYEVDEEYGEYLCYERSDAFVIAVLKWALVHHHDIKCEAPMTARLKKQVEEIFIPAVCNENKNTISPIQIITQTAPSMDKAVNAVGASVTCGVDSLYSIYSHRDEITHLVINNCHGAMDSAARADVFERLVNGAKTFIRVNGGG